MIDTTLHPKNQKQLIGFSKEFDRLIRLESGGKLHPAWLISGQRGIGKATFSYRIARHLLADSSDNSTFYNMLIDQGSHPNLLVLEKTVDEDGKPENEIKINQVRKLVDFARQSPAIPGWRIVIIDAIDELNRNAANSLLKILEEPPEKFLFLMVCHSMGTLLPTIRSRCSILSMPALTLEEIKKSNIHIDPIILDAAAGSLGKAMILKEINLPEFCAKATEILQDLSRGSVLKLTGYVAGLDKKDKTLTAIPDIIQWMSRELVLCSNGISNNPLVKDASLVNNPAHWGMVHMSLNRYFHLAKGSHPDPIHLIQGAFLLMNGPENVHLD